MISPTLSIARETIQMFRLELSQTARHAQRFQRSGVPGEVPVFTATAVVSVLLAAVLVFSATQKLSHKEAVVRSYAKVGVPEGRLNALALLLLAGAAGLLGGLVRPPLGVAASCALVGYFLLAVAAHVRAGDRARLATPLALLILAAAALALRLASA
ncbi:DoxX family protein [Streptomyces bathyalis]|uniref:DoxX family protein n=1 Tax=Streptomyces bathyalis TaxID=2710756 RepID=A0A7T1WUH6_9ACTN|nr:DoxX family protein [Streptomyces bathyalis]QPP07915.1 DoxX family protein [Streptomyces bathyalis]